MTSPDEASPGTAPLRVVRLSLEFDGTDFLGWQRQAEGRTVQGVVEEGLGRVLGSPHAVVASGRIDAGAHARDLLVSFRTAHPMPAATLGRALDAVLPPDVGVRDAREAPPGFHARRDAWWKWYRYTILRSRRRRPLLRRTTWRWGGPLDDRALEEGAALLRGRHDFASFAAAGPVRGGTLRTLFDVAWEAEGDLLHLDVVGEGFLHHMVRNLAGSLVQAAGPRGGGADALARVLAARDRRAAGPTAPAAGLCLGAVAVRGEAPPGTVPSRLRLPVESAPRRAPGDAPCRS